MWWLNFLHFYQPANAEFYSIRKALDKSYWRLLRLFEEHLNLRMTINISGCLLERLELAKEQAFLDRLKFLVKQKRIELTGSAAYHGFLPLLPEAEVVRQIKANEKILRHHFGPKFKPTGFFLPEMAYSPAVAKIIKRLGYHWIVLDELTFSGLTNKKPQSQRSYLDAASGLQVVFRQHQLSSAYPPDKIWHLFKERDLIGQSKKLNQAVPGWDDMIITATDAELYGLRHEDPTVTISDYLKKIDQKNQEKVNLCPSSWESTVADLKHREPYALWQNKRNKIQTELWSLANLSLALGDKFKTDKNFSWHRWHLVRGLASCTFWWASARDFSKIFGPYAWSPDEIERGLEDLIRSVRSFANPKTKKAKLVAEKHYLKIKKLVWEEHWKKHWQKNI
jgi:hypothetical protein